MNNKDLIEDIKAKLKDAQELPYREGAWENYAAQQGGFVAPKVIIFRRLASIAAAGLAVLGVSLYIFNSQNSDSIADKELAQATSKSILQAPQTTKVDNDTQIKRIPKDLTLDNNNYLATTVIPNSSTISRGVSITSLEGLDESDLINFENPPHQIVQLNAVKPNIQSHKSKMSIIDAPFVKQPSITTLAHQTVNSALSIDVENLKPSSKMSLGDKLQLGLYVSPNRTSDQFDVGAGFLISYSLSKKISLRTGTSYNSYAVGVIKDPLETNNTEMISMENAYNSSPIASDKNTVSFKQEMILPNINAVMGKVESLEIPLDVTYNFNKGFYSSAGVSYSVIINQEREARYIENGGLFSLQDDASLIPSAAQSVNKVQTKTVKSSQENVNPKGFNGFANFSLGKKVNINTKMSLSVEPFVKVPLGQFRKSDLDYTNSGIRIITSF